MIERKYPDHPLSQLFTLKEGPPLWELADDIKENGLKEEIVIHEQMILDGRRRFLACVRADVKPKYREFGSRSTDGTDPLAFVVSLNLKRRHLTDADRADAAAKILVANKRGTNNCTSVQGPPIGGNTKNVAEMLHISPRSVERAKTILLKGENEVQEAVKSQEISLSKGEEIALKPRAEQAKAVVEARAGKGEPETRADIIHKTAKALGAAMRGFDQLKMTQRVADTIQELLDILHGRK